MGWFGKKQEPPPHPSSDRYKGKPLLILLENYILDCIGCLPPEKVPTLTSLVQRVYGGGHDWKVTLRSTLHLEDALDENLKQTWLRNQDLARQTNKVLLTRGLRPHGRGPELLIADRLSQGSCRRTIGAT